MSAGVGLRATGLSKAFGPTQALREVSFEVGAGTIHALLGGNGSGKSTLVKVLAGVELADAGRIEVGAAAVDARRTGPEWAAAAGLRFVHQGAPTAPALTVADDFALSAGYGSRLLGRVKRRQINRRARQALDRFGIDVPVTARMGELRPATRTMIAIARAFRDEAMSVLVLDEPTAALPPDEAEQVLGAIRRSAAAGHTVLLVTHRLDEVIAVAGSATFLRNGAHLETRELEGMDERALVKRIAGSDDLSRERRSAPRGERERLVLSDVSVGPLAGVDLTVARAEIVGLSGLLGSGRSSLLRGLFGDLPIGAGEVTIDGERIRLGSPADAIRHGIAYVPEDRAEEATFADQPLRQNLTIVDARRYGRRMRRRRRAEGRDAELAIADFDVRAPSPAALLSTLSGGNQQKVVLARWLRLGPRVLLLDEPTQGVDVGARDAIHGLIRRAADEGAAVLLASSDGAELATLCDRVVGLREGRVTGAVQGDEVTPRRCLELAHGVVAEPAGGLA